MIIIILLIFAVILSIINMTTRLKSFGKYDKTAKIGGNHYSERITSNSGEIIDYSDYPYKKYKMSADELNSRMDRLTEYNPLIKHHKYKIFSISNISAERLIYKPVTNYTYISVNESHYDKYDNLSDFWQEEQRLSCKRNDQEINALEYYSLNKKRLKKLGGDTREILYEEFMECTSFKPSLLVGFAKLFWPEKSDLPDGISILDISSGWGDRLLGAIACSKYYGSNPNHLTYFSTDPNPLVHKAYSEMKEFYGVSDKEFITEISAFQTVKLPEQKFDLVFTSPPYFDLEIYNSDDSTKLLNGESLDMWFDKFLLTSLKKAFDALKTGGYMVININDARNRPPFVERMLDEMDNIGEYLGCIAQWDDTSKKSPQPFWIWKK